MHRRKARPNLLDYEFLVKVKDLVTGVHMAGGLISRKMVIAIGTGVIKANFPSKLKDFGGHIVLTERWARGLLKSMEWSKRKGTTGKIEPSKQFLLEEKLIQRPIVSIIEEHDIPKELILKTHCIDYWRTWHTEGTYSESGSNTLATCFPWEICF